MNFEYGGKSYTSTLIEENLVKEGVNCKVYAVNGTSDFDLGLVIIKKGYKTPLQKIMKGVKTVERYISGKGSLYINRGCKNERIINFDNSSIKDYEVKIGETMQWEAIEGDLTFLEICFPPYQEGRFLNINE